jgi:hypothetical protein
MNNKFSERLEEFLASECSDYDLKYSWEWDEDCNKCVVKISRNINPLRETELYFKFNKSTEDLLIEMCEDSFEVVREFDHTIKYFWMILSPRLFPDA